MIPELLAGWSPSEVTRPYWDAAATGRLCLQRCQGCGALQHPPRALCTGCGGPSRLVWEEVSGAGSIYSSTAIHRALIPALATHVPYTLAVVELDEGPRMVTAVRGASLEAVTIGSRVRVAFESVSAEVVLPVFTLA
ncbi:MAG TPA: Zn-ribbon domain-containing OB-fold protein [Solirubrobacteraceae bacterium]|nr:Zn-ribbon domain-containing OB-fold protein [Solirubrobacteraceae bacterium]